MHSQLLEPAIILSVQADTKCFIVYTISLTESITGLLWEYTMGGFI